jgi:hypothetical protein
LLYNVRSTANKPSDYAVVGNFLAIEPLAVMFRGGGLEFKQFANRQIADLIASGEFKRMYTKWFEQAIPPKNVSFDMPMNFLMRDLLRFPSDKLSIFPERASAILF